MSQDKDYDVVVVGGGPAGASAAWAAKAAGATVLCIDKAVFPRDKPCGDGITPRSVSLLAEMGIGEEQLKLFNKVSHITVTAGSRSWTRRWPERQGLPAHGYVAARTLFDQLLLDNARADGVEVVEGVRAQAAVVEGDAVRGVRVTRRDGTDELICAKVTVAADGMSSRVARSIGLAPIPSNPCAITVRAQVPADYPFIDALEVFPKISYDGRPLPGYGWVFPMGDGRANVGVGFVTSFADWKDIRMLRLYDDFVKTLPPEWNIPGGPEVKRMDAIQGWKLPLGFAVSELWRPGAVLVGDAAGVAKPYTGAGISKAIQSGLLGGAAAAQSALSGESGALRDYETRLRSIWGSYYRRGLVFTRMIGHPRLSNLIVGATMRSPKFAMRAFGLQKR